jgi:hypothetical protein
MIAVVGDNPRGDAGDRHRLDSRASPARGTAATSAAPPVGAPAPVRQPSERPSPRAVRSRGASSFARHASSMCFETSYRPLVSRLGLTANSTSRRCRCRHPEEVSGVLPRGYLVYRARPRRRDPPRGCSMSIRTACGGPSGDDQRCRGGGKRRRVGPVTTPRCSRRRSRKTSAKPPTPRRRTASAHAGQRRSPQLPQRV